VGRRRILAATALAGVGALGVGVRTAGAADHDRQPVIALTPEAAAMLWLDDGRPPATTTPADPADPADPGDGAVAQTITVTIQPGPLLLIDPPTTVTLRRVGTTPNFEGTIDGIRLADTRADEPGWELRMRFDGIDGAPRPDRLRIEVERIDAFADTVDGVSAGHRGSVGRGETIVLARAEPATGHGSFDVTAAVHAVLPHVPVDEVVARVAFEAV